MLITEIARAKVNLTLTVRGRRADGFHEIESLVTFADVGDRITLVLDQPPRVETTGPFAAAIEGPNLLDRTLSLLGAHDTGLRLGAVELEKRLPVAAGVGGGSADAAALLRAVMRANPQSLTADSCHELAQRLGADVPACLGNRPAMVRGIGEWVCQIDELPHLPAVLVNPRIPLPTAQVFRALAAPLAEPGPKPEAPPPLATVADAVDFIRSRGNDLEAPARKILPLIGEMKERIAALPGCLLAGMSGSGPTCFGLFADGQSASAAAHLLSVARPAWWVLATVLQGSGRQDPVRSPG